MELMDEDDKSIEMIDDKSMEELTKSNLNVTGSSKIKRAPTDELYIVELVKRKRLPRIPSEYSSELSTMIQKMLSIEAKDRPDAVSLLESDLL